VIDSGATDRAEPAGPTGGADRADQADPADGAGQPTPGGARALSPALDRAERIVGLVVATGLGAVSAMYEAFLTPLSYHGIRVPLSLVLALVGNTALVWFSREVTGRMSAVLLPGAAWVVVMFLAAGQTTERDLVLTSNNWVGLTTMFAGALAFAVAAYWLITRPLLRSRASAR
jgi:hypothetical protein